MNAWSLIGLDYDDTRSLSKNNRLHLTLTIRRAFPDSLPLVLFFWRINTLAVCERARTCTDENAFLVEQEHNNGKINMGGFFC
jgi:hypothetical protein